MLPKEIASPLKGLVSNYDLHAALNSYIDYRIEEHRKVMDVIDDNTLIRRAQGAILELKKFKTLRDEVKAHEERKDVAKPRDTDPVKSSN